MGDRIDVALVCSECQTRNYKTTRKPEQVGQLEKKKFCPTKMASCHADLAEWKERTGALNCAGCQRTAIASVRS